MHSRRLRAAVAVALIATLGCAPHHFYARAQGELKGHPRNSWWGRSLSVLAPTPAVLFESWGPGEVTDANAESVLQDLAQARESALAVLQDETAEAATKGDLHEQTSWIVPLSYLSEAEVYGALGQTTRQEEACWSAIESADKHLGQHIDIARAKGGAPFASYHVFFRREKVRRHAFLLLIETYRRAGEVDLEALSRLQTVNSSAYLDSPVADREQELIRRYENAEWFAQTKTVDVQVKADLDEAVETVKRVFLFVITVLAGAANQMAADSTTDMSEKARLDGEREQLIQAWSDVDNDIERQIESIRRNAASKISDLDQDRRGDMAHAITKAFNVLKVSPEVAALPAYATLRAKATALDDYVTRNGFDSGAATALVAARSALDDLTRATQAQRRGAR